ncbi:cytochrome P450 [Archangium gephyra]|uniref:Cytochrome P450 n=1 Tax=Archangium gephyra TaxID=48 RepID=A0AAC8TCL2_9BACT|nr:cytochrome P450 [Archangium gephyra]AKJ00990.1 putative cytochrome P450 hydroxylase [Archangium gephyra]REG26154.1 cytochrome P450 [Archangium gephyra]
MMNLFSDEVRRNPYPAYEQLRSRSPVLHEPHSDLWMVFDYESVKRALQDHEAFSSIVAPPSAMTSQWLVFADPPRHSKLRALLLRAFTPRAVASLEPRILALSHELLDRTMARGEMDLAEDFSVPLPLRVIAEMLGVPTTDLPHFKRWSDVMMALGYAVAGSEEAARVQREFSEVTEEMRVYVRDLAGQRRETPREDLLTRLVEAEVEGERLTEDELLGFVQLLLSAGHETTTNLLNNALLCFLEHPEQLARLRAEPALLPSAIEEVLRYRSPVQAMFRVTRSEVSLHGQVIPPGKMVLAMIGSANRDPRKFQDPDRFDISREPNPHIAFGHGIHFCIGAPLSRLEARVGLSVLLERMRDVALASDAPWEPRRAIHVHGPTRLPIRFTPGT